MKNNRLIKISVAGLLALSAMFTSAETASLPALGNASYAAEKLLEAPGSIKATVNAVKVKLSWAKVWNAKAYRVLMYDNESGKYKTYKNVSGLKCIVSDLEMGKEYRFRIAALKQNGSKYVLQTPSDVIKVTTKTLKLPKAPSADFTGLASSKGNTYGFENGKSVIGRTVEAKGKLYLIGEDGILLKGGVHTIDDRKYYSDENGVVTCSNWMFLKNNVYYYADKTGKITEYSLDAGGRTAAYLRINGEYAKPDDLPYRENKSRTAYYRVGNDYYRMYMLASGVYSASGENLMFQNVPVYDILTGKLLANFRGYPVMDETGFISGGKVFNTADGTVWTFGGKNTKPTAVKGSDIIVLRKNVYRNHSGALDLTLEVCNNTGKTIKNIVYTVYAVDSAGNKVRDDSRIEFNFYLQDSAQMGRREVSEKEWWSVVKTDKAADIVIRGAEIEFTDGTSKIISTDKMSIL